MTSLRFVEKLRDLVGNVEVVLSDIWGVVHNGLEAFPEACEALHEFRRQGGTVILITNAPRPADSVQRQLRKFGVADEIYDAIVSSGDLTRHFIAGHPGRKMFWIGPELDSSIHRGLDPVLAPLEQADYIVCTGLFDDETESAEDYRAMMLQARERNLTLICANPDIVVERGDRLIYCAGAIAELYRELGGEVIFYGKPHRPIYERAMELAAERQQRTHGHIVVDEVQDLTPMELRMVGRRSLSGSMTLVGDIAQATGPWAPGSWDDVVAHLPARRGWRKANLSVSYRAPSEVMELAAAVLAAALPGVEAPEPVRQTGHGPRFLPWDGPGAGDGRGGGEDDASFGSLVARTVNEEVRAVASTSGGEDGSVGVLVPAALMDEVRGALDRAGVTAGEAGAGALDVQVSLLALTNAKGLEFDSVVVVEPARIVSEQGQGLRALYVALTRCTRRLAIVYREPLPGPLAGWPTGDQKAVKT